MPAQSSPAGVDTTAHLDVHKGVGAGRAGGSPNRDPGSGAGTPRRPSTAVRRAALPPALAAATDRFERHLTLERGISPHSVRAYVGDVVGLLDHVARMGGVDLDRLDLRALRSWLARLRSTGTSRSTLARRSAAARTFTA
ncbi:MAG TPA: site-specific integrase, partial [Mycobacteriales bacterium]|nr:site-specific integrase [Mycobacteriales bacterium]